MENIQNFKELMFLKNFSDKTSKNYLSIITNVSKRLDKMPSDISEVDLRSYLLSKPHYSSSTRMAVINAFKSYYRLCLDKDFNNKILPRPRVEQKQPDVLSVKEFQQMVVFTKNIKHKAVICLMYSCALRVGEVVNLKVQDIDATNNKIQIKNGKGKIDRVVMLDKNVLKLLREYWQIYHTKTYLFEGSKGGKYSEKSIQTLVKSVANKIGLRKKISSHSLRHSCLTQMVKDGVDLRTVQKIAGHKNINTTAGYIKIADVDVLGTVSPISKIKM